MENKFASMVNLGRAFKVIGYAALYDLRSSRPTRGTFDDYCRRVGAFASSMLRNEYGY